TRCSQNLSQNRAIREVKFDHDDQICLDHKPLVVVGQDAGSLELRTFPDTNTRVVAHLPAGTSMPADATFFEAFTPSGLVIGYGNTESGKPLTQSGAPQARLATKVKAPRGNTMSYAYCADTDPIDGHALEYTLDEIRYTSFEGAGSLGASRAVTFVYA